MSVDLVKAIGDHPVDIASGRMVAPEEAFERSALAEKPTAAKYDSPEAFEAAQVAYEHDQRLLDEGRIITAKITPVELEGEALKQRAEELDVEGRTTMSAAKLKRAVAEAEARQPEEATQ